MNINLVSLLGADATPEEAWKRYSSERATKLTYPEFWNLYQRQRRGAKTPEQILTQPQTGGATTGPMTAVSNSNAFPNTAKQPNAAGLTGQIGTERKQGQAQAGQTYPLVPPQAQTQPAGLDIPGLAQPLTGTPATIDPLTQKLMAGFEQPRAGTALTQTAAEQALQRLTAPAGWTPEEQQAMFQRAAEPVQKAFQEQLTGLEQLANVRGGYFGGGLPTVQGEALTEFGKTLAGISTDIQVQNALQREQQKTQRIQDALNVAAQQHGFGSQEYQDLSNLLANQQSYQMGLEQQALERARGLGALQLEEMQQLGAEGLPGTMELAAREQALGEYTARAGVGQAQQRINIENRLANWTVLSGQEQNQLQRDIFDQQTTQWQQEFAAEYSEKEAQRLFEEKMWDKQEQLTKQGWGFESMERISAQNFQARMNEREAALTRAGWTHEAAMAQANREWQSGERRETEAWDEKMQTVQNNLVRQGWTVETARQQAQFEHDTYILGKEQAFERMERIGTQNFQAQRETVQNALIERGWAREDAQKEADRVLTRQLAYLDSHDRRAMFNDQLAWDKEQFEKEFGFEYEQFYEANRQRSLDRGVQLKEIAGRFAVDMRQLSMAEAQFTQSHALEVTRLANQYDIEDRTLDEAIRAAKAAELQDAMELSQRHQIELGQLMETKRQFDATEERLQDQFLADLEQRDKELAEAVRQFNTNDLRRMMEISDERRIEAKTFTEAKRQYDLNRQDSLEQAAWENGFQTTQLEEMIREYDVGDLRRMMELSAERGIEYAKLQRAAFESDRMFAETQRQFDEGIEDGMNSRKIVAALEFVTDPAFASMFGLAEWPEGWESWSQQKQTAWIRDNPKLMKGAQVLNTLLGALGVADIESDFFLDSTANYVQEQSGQTVDVPTPSQLKGLTPAEGLLLGGGLETLFRPTAELVLPQTPGEYEPIRTALLGY